MSERFFGAVVNNPALVNAIHLPKVKQDKHFFKQNNDNYVVSCSYSKELDFFEDEALVVIVDGHLYNQEKFPNGNCFSEIVAKRYKDVGFKSLLSELDGDFAISLYDKTQKRVWLARDRFGLKPLYYIVNSSGVGFASYPHWLLAFPGASLDFNHQTIGLFAGSHYRTIDNAPTQTLFKDIQQVPAAHLMSIRIDGSVELQRYWALEEQDLSSYSQESLIEKYRTLMLKSVGKRLQHTKTPGFTLSGGMDSSSVLSCAVDVSKQKQHAFTAVYSDKTYDESEDIQPMLESKVSDWHQTRVDDPDVFANVRKMLEIHGEPVGTATWLSHFQLAQDVSQQGFDALFGGLGGDELNAGEFEYFFYYFADMMANEQGEKLKHEVQEWVKHHDHPIYKKNMEVASKGWKLLTDPSVPGKCLPDAGRILRYQAAVNPNYFDIKAFVPDMPHPFNSYLKSRTYQDMYLETLPCCLRAEDRQAYAFGLENFLPFLDTELVEFMFSMPFDTNIKNGITKSLLREAMTGILPEVTRTRVAKTGWNAPAHLWFSGESLDELRDLIQSDKFCQRGLYNPKEVNRLLDEHCKVVKEQALVDNHMMFFWQLVNIELWFDFIEEWYKEVKCETSISESV